jgi:hypothetical protein
MYDMERVTARGYLNSLATMSVVPLGQVRRSSERVETYIRLLNTLGIWGDKLSYA